MVGGVGRVIEDFEANVLYFRHGPCSLMDRGVVLVIQHTSFELSAAFGLDFLFELAQKGTVAVTCHFFAFLQIVNHYYAFCVPEN